MSLDSYSGKPNLCQIPSSLSTAVLRQRFQSRQIHIAQAGGAPNPRFTRQPINTSYSQLSLNRICPATRGRQIRAMTSSLKYHPKKDSSSEEERQELNHPPLLRQLRLQERQNHASISSLGSSDRESSFDSVFDYDPIPPKPRICRSVTMSSSSCRSTPLTSRRRRLASLNRSSESTDSSASSRSSREGTNLADAKSNYRILILGSKRVGKTSIVRQFLYDKFSSSYTETMDDMYRGEFEIQGRPVGFDIQDVSGSYVYEFPAMRSVSLASADAFIIVFSMDSSESWDEVAKLRDMVHESKDPDVPIVVVGNKTDLPYDDGIPQESLEATVIFDWENGYVECSAKERLNINKIFRELLQQAKSRYDFTTQVSSGSSPNTIVGTFSRHGSTKSTGKSVFEEHMRRRQSLPVAPPDAQGPAVQSVPIPAPVPKRERSFKALKNRRASLAALRRDSCKVS